MVTYVLDASAVLRFLDGEAGVDRVKEIFRLALKDECKVVLSAINWGEVFGKLHQRYGGEITGNRMRHLQRNFPMQMLLVSSLPATQANMF